MKRLALTLATLMLAACGGGGGRGTSPAAPVSPSTAAPATATSPVQINLGDDPADRLLAVNVTVNSVALHGADGHTVTVLASPRPMELMHLMGTVAPLAVANVPHGTYTGATMTVGAATVMHMDLATGQAMQRQVTGPMTSHVTFGSPLVVGTAPMVVNFDMNMWASVGIDSAGNVSMSPALTAHHNAAVAGSQHHEQVSAYTAAGTEATFVLTVPSDSAFARLSGKTSVTVHQRAATLRTSAANVTNGSVVQVRGLLFNDAGTLRLVAGRIRM